MFLSPFLQMLSLPAVAGKEGIQLEKNAAFLAFDWRAARRRGRPVIEDETRSHWPLFLVDSRCVLFGSFVRGIWDWARERWRCT